MLRPSFVSTRRKERPPCICDTHGISGNVFANPHASSSAPYPQELNPWRTTIQKPLHMSTAEKDQKIIMELSGRLQELQNEVNFMNDSKDLMDAESTCSGNPHVTSPPGLFPRHPPFEGLLKPAFISKRQTEEPPNIWDTSGISGIVFAHPQASSSAPYPQELNSSWTKTVEEPIHMSTAEKWKTRTRPRSEIPIWTVSQRFSHLQWRRLFKELWGRPTTTADF